MSAPATSERATDVRSHILDTAQRLIGARGFSAVGLNEILAAAGVPKGSFYHYFASKEVFGRDLLDHYFDKYLAEVDALLADADVPARARLGAYWQFWRQNQERDDPDGKCLAVKLGAEVSDISEDMRTALKHGTSAIIDRLSRVVEQGLADGSIRTSRAPHDVAETLYQLWFGASIMAKIARNGASFDTALAATDQVLGA
ncbi:TetR/AcrR family transcriptional repressor of nem operon [Sphingomonas zeicaulis]|uniref:TetR/AcrR family transcriptional regulator n=1 Tax=Sphingomonas zeicaulis TaxID=1632740 RepID=UPI003D1E1888